MYRCGCLGAAALFSVQVWQLRRHRSFFGSLLQRSKRGAENSNNNLALLSRMGTACSRGRRASRASQTEEESDDAASQDWELIAPAVPVVVDQPIALFAVALFFRGTSSCLQLSRRLVCNPPLFQRGLDFNLLLSQRGYDFNEQ